MNVLSLPFARVLLVALVAFAKPPSMFPVYDALEYTFSLPTPLGMSLVTRQGGAWPVVKKVHGKAQAAKAGVQAGMLLVAINSKPTDHLSLDQVTARLKMRPLICVFRSSIGNSACPKHHDTMLERVPRFRNNSHSEANCTIILEMLFAPPPAPELAELVVQEGGMINLANVSSIHSARYGRWVTWTDLTARVSALLHTATHSLQMRADTATMGCKPVISPGLTNELRIIYRPYTPDSSSSSNESGEGTCTSTPAVQPAAVLGYDIRRAVGLGLANQLMQHLHALEFALVANAAFLPPAKSLFRASFAEHFEAAEYVEHSFRDIFDYEGIMEYWYQRGQPIAAQNSQANVDSTAPLVVKCGRESVKTCLAKTQQEAALRMHLDLDPPPPPPPPLRMHLDLTQFSLPPNRRAFSAEVLRSFRFAPSLLSIANTILCELQGDGRAMGRRGGEGGADSGGFDGLHLRLEQDANGFFENGSSNEELFEMFVRGLRGLRPEEQTGEQTGEQRKRLLYIASGIFDYADPAAPQYMKRLQV
jgi:hypothetical protein